MNDKDLMFLRFQRASRDPELFAQALAEERIATVERIRERLHKIPNPHGDGSFPATAIYDILDEEAAR